MSRYELWRLRRLANQCERAAWRVLRKKGNAELVSRANDLQMSAKFLLGATLQREASVKAGT